MLGLISLAIYLAIERLSHRFVFGEGHEERPIVAVLALFGGAFGCYLMALRVALRQSATTSLSFIVFFALLFRLVLLASKPIQEIDIYRYLWDGRVSTAGISPFRYSPRQVADAANAADEHTASDLRRLVELRDSTVAVRTIFDRVHYPEVSTVYPPVSQWVFAIVTWATPAGAPLRIHILAMKLALVVFDLGTLALLVLTLRRVGWPTAWCLAYAWCPLVLKEVANSVHLDTIAVFFTTLTIYFLVRGQTTFTSPAAAPGAGHQTWWAILPAVAWALATMAKLYPVVLFPLLARDWWRSLRWRSVVPLTVYASLVAFILWPVLVKSSQSEPDVNRPNGPIRFMADGATDLPPGASNQATTPSSGASTFAGLKTFLTRWEMNDFLFMLLVENLKPSDATGEHSTPWFSVVPKYLRSQLTESLESLLGPSSRHGDHAFLLARLITGVLFIIVCLWLALRRSCEPPPLALLRNCFLTLAWFWLLLPTQNPWYLLWAIPFLPFATQRSWLLLSGLALLYYLRFWFEYHFAESPVPGTPYRGTEFFDFVIVWIEFAPWLLLLGLEFLARRPVPATDCEPDHRAIRAE